MSDTLNNAGKYCDRSTYRRCRFWQKKKVIFSDEAHFDLGGYVNKQNFHIWGRENPHASKTSHCLVRILENEQGEALTVNGDRYRAMLNEFLFTKIEEENIGNI